MKVGIVGSTSAIGQALGQAWRERGWKVQEFGRRIEAAGSLDSLVTLTGQTFDAKIRDMSDSAWSNVIDATLSAPMRAIREGQGLIEDGGSIVVVGSIVGSTGAYGAANYAAAKAGLVGLVRSAALELAKRNIRVNLLELGFVDAGMGARLPQEVKRKAIESIPMKRFATLAEVIEAVEFLVKAPYMTGNVLTVAGGIR